MRRYRVGMRWWLGGTFALIAALTAVLVATVSSWRADRAVRSNSEAIAVGKTVSAAFGIERSIESGSLGAELPAIARRQGLALFVFTSNRRLLSPPVSHGVAWTSVPDGATALATALADRRFVETATRAGATLVALPLRRTSSARALVALAPRPAAYGASLSIFHREVLRAALWAMLAAAVAGLLAAALITRRLRRIGTAAAAIERGRFDIRLRPRFRDEIGTLAESIDRMRARLGASFEQLRDERDRLERLFERLHEGVVAVDGALVVRFANASAEGLAGLEGGKTLPEAWAGVPLQELGRALFRHDAEISEARTDPIDGRTISVVGVPAGASDLAVIVFSDITEHERRERAEREFVSNASHELRTPISAITSAVEALQAGASEVPADRDAFVDLIGRQAARLGRLTRSLLIMARAQTQQEPVKLEPIELRPLLEQVVASTVPGPDDAVRIECQDRLSVRAQRDLAEEVISNLLGNALKHAPESTILLSARPRGATVAIEVSDTGPGMSSEVRGRVFDRFYSARQGARDGFGLGLAIARDAARALGGSIEIESDPGSGTTARVILLGVEDE